MRENCTSGLMSEEEKRSEFQHATALLLDSTDQDNWTASYKL
jgi:hypothetical protein